VFLIGCANKAQTQTNSALTEAFTKAGLAPLKKSMPSSDFTLPLLNENTIRLHDLKGFVVVLNFWATWCPPCREEIPSLEAVYQRFGDENIKFIAVDIQESKEDVSAFVKQFGMSFPVALDGKGEVSLRYGIQSIPMTFIIDAKGDIIAAAVGSRNWNSPEMIRVFGLLLQSEQ
jgi:thiol-disulfide isomerase/thioredoxin